jgi:transcriptional regulator with XRE-family HTH domain
VPEPSSGDLPIGRRIAIHRRRLGLTQEGLAMRLHRSRSWVTKIERGERPLDSVRTLLEVARALGVEVRELTGQPWFPEPGGPGHEAVPAIRKALLALDPSREAQPRALAALEQDVLATGRLWQTEPNCYSAVVPLLPDLLTETRIVARTATGGDRRTADRVLSLLHQITQEVMARLGEPDLSWIAAHHSLLAAEEADDPVLAAASAWRVCHALLRVDDVDEVHTMATRAAASLQRSFTDPGREQLSVYGALHLVAAVATARAGEGREALDLLGLARATADRIGGDRNDFWMTFGPTNVAIHGVAIQLELGNPLQALREATAVVDLSGLPSLERRSTHHVHLAHAHSLRREDDEAVRALLVAERSNPEGLRYNMLVRDLVRGLLRRRRRISGLRGLAGRLHVLNGH